MKPIWYKGANISEEVERFTVGRDREMDMFLARYDVLGTIAHIRMLETAGLLNSNDLQVLEKELREIY